MENLVEFFIGLGFKKEWIDIDENNQFVIVLGNYGNKDIFKFEEEIIDLMEVIPNKEDRRLEWIIGYGDDLPNALVIGKYFYIESLSEKQKELLAELAAREMFDEERSNEDDEE